MNEKITHIKIEYSSSAMWGNVDPVEDGWDESESFDAFEEILEATLQEAYPTAKIEIIRGINDQVHIDDYTDHEEMPWVNQIIEKVWNGDWMVAT
jgi:hypothetical protein